MGCHSRAVEAEGFRLLSTVGVLMIEADKEGRGTRRRRKVTFTVGAGARKGINVGNGERGMGLGGGKGGATGRIVGGGEQSDIGKPEKLR